MTTQRVCAYCDTPGSDVLSFDGYGSKPSCLRCHDKRTVAKHHDQISTCTLCRVNDASSEPYKDGLCGPCRTGAAVIAIMRRRLPAQTWNRGNGPKYHRIVRTIDDFHVVAQLGSKSDLVDALAADVIVDVSLPSVSRKVLELALENEKSILIGTSGWSAERISSVDSLIAAHPEVGVIFIANFSLGSAVASHLATLAARHFASIEIVEAHGVHKVDSPSGTAVSTAERIAKVRDGNVSAPHADQRARGQLVAGVPVHSLRMAGIVAKQDVILGGEGETVKITHTTLSDRSYEAGIMASLRALPGLSGKLVGLDRVLNISGQSV